MLTHISIRNIALIDALELDFAAGFTALTGETGAGKSLLLDALGLALGARADAGLIRHGQTVAEVCATFRPSLSQELKILLDEQGVEPEEGLLVLRRQLKGEGAGAASKAWLNGTPVPASVLVRLGALLVDVHAQHGTQALLAPAAQRDVLDALGGLQHMRAQTQAAYLAWQAARQAYAAAQQELARAQQNAALLTAWREELEELDYKPGEEEDLARQRTRLQNGAQLRQCLAGAEEALTAERGALAAVRMAARHAQQAARLDAGLQAQAGRLENALAELEDVAHELAHAGEEDETGPQSLEEIDDRLHALRAAARKHQAEVTALPAVLAGLTRQTSDVAQLVAQEEELEKAQGITRQAYVAAAEGLTQARQRLGAEKGPVLNAALKDLQLPHAELTIAVTGLPEAQWSAAGNCHVELLLAANPGNPPQAIGKVASGGELSRIMLALKRVLYQGLAPQTVVFDEIDTGLSGRAASAVGAAMAQLGGQHQVLTITHHPQVAAAAGWHGRIAKQVAGGATSTRIQVLEDAERLEELARLLSGDRITPQARAAAQALREESVGKAAA